MDKAKTGRELDRILGKALSRSLISREEIVFLLGLNDPDHLRLLFEAAGELRYRYFKNRIFLYGFIYFSTWCANQCAFCSYRKPNSLAVRYRKSSEEIRETVYRLKESGVHLVDLTMGEDPFFHRRPGGFGPLIDLVGRIKVEFGLPVMVSPGVLSRGELAGFSSAGADWYACYQETFNRGLFSKLRINQSFERRLNSKRLAVQAGLLVEEGILLGVGETPEDVADSLEHMDRMGAQQVRVMSFVPQEGIPLKNMPAQARTAEFKTIAVMRLLFPDRLIPASLDVDGVEGLEARIGAGANVVTSLIPPRSGLVGVAQHARGIEDGSRTVRGVLPVLEKMGMEAACREEYISWVKSRKDMLNRQCGGNRRVI